MNRHHQDAHDDTGEHHAPAGDGHRTPPHLSPVTDVPVTAPATAVHLRLNGPDEEHCRALAESGAELPPIVVHRATMQVIDGVHRLRAAQLRGDDVIAVRFFDGSLRDAYVLAVRANVTHGLPLSKAERMLAAAQIIGTHPQWSDRAVAAVTGLSARTVAVLRGRSTEQRVQSNSRIGRDGRVRPVSSAESRRMAGELMKSDPGASLRQIARTVGLSPATVLDVRRRLDRGEDPVPPSRRGTPGRAGRPPGKEPEREDLDVLLRSLTKDPALRFNAAGRVLLRWLHKQAATTQEQGRLLDEVPPHCAGTIAQCVRRCAETWLEFAEQLENRRIPARRAE